MKIKMNIKRMVVGLMTVSICCGCADLSEDSLRQLSISTVIFPELIPPLSSSMEKMHPTLRVPVLKMYVPR